MNALKAILNNKSETTAVVGIIAAIGAKLGLGLDNELVLAILGVVSFVIGAQGAANHGVAAATVAAASPAAPTVVNAPAVEVNK